MKKLRPKDILLNDPYFEQTMYCGPTELRKAKRINIFGKWQKIKDLAATLLKEGSLTFTHDIDTQQAQRRLTFRMYEQTASRLFINTYFWTSQLQKEIYVGTIHIEAYEDIQQLRDFQYRGIIDLVIIKQDDDIVDIAPEFKLIQEVKHEFAVSLGMYLLAVSELSWVDPETSMETASMPSVLLGKEREELQQLRKEKETLEACNEELLRLRIEAKNRKAVESELQRLRHELNTERTERAKDKNTFETVLKEKDRYIEKIKEKAAQQLNDMLSMRDELKSLKAAVHASATASQTAPPQNQTASHPAPKKEETQELSIPAFMSQHDYTRDLDNVLNCQRVSYIGGSIEWQQYVASRFPQLVMLIRQRDPMLAVAKSNFVIINLYEGETEEIKRVMTIAKEAHCPMITTSAYNLNNMSKDILKAVQQL